MPQLLLDAVCFMTMTITQTRMIVILAHTVAKINVHNHLKTNPTEIPFQDTLNALETILKAFKPLFDFCSRLLAFERNPFFLFFVYF